MFSVNMVKKNRFNYKVYKLVPTAFFYAINIQYHVSCIIHILIMIIVDIVNDKVNLSSTISYIYIMYESEHRKLVLPHQLVSGGFIQCIEIVNIMYIHFFLYCCPNIIKLIELLTGVSRMSTIIAIY